MVGFAVWQVVLAVAIVAVMLAFGRSTRRDPS